MTDEQQTERKRLLMLNAAANKKNKNFYKLTRPEVLKIQHLTWDRSDRSERHKWRDKRSDLTDFYNYGFNEHTFQFYANKVSQISEKTSSEIQKNYREILEKNRFPFNRAGVLKDQIPIDYGGLSVPYDQLLLPHNFEDTLDFYDSIIFLNNIISNEEGFYAIGEQILHGNEILQDIQETFYDKLLNQSETTEDDKSIYLFEEALKQIFHTKPRVQEFKQEQQFTVQQIEALQRLMQNNPLQQNNKNGLPPLSANQPISNIHPNISIFSQFCMIPGQYPNISPEQLIKPLKENKQISRSQSVEKKKKKKKDKEKKIKKDKKDKKKKHKKEKKKKPRTDEEKSERVESQERSIMPQPAIENIVFKAITPVILEDEEQLPEHPEQGIQGSVVNFRQPQPIVFSSSEHSSPEKPYLNTLMPIPPQQQLLQSQQYKPKTERAWPMNQIQGILNRNRKVEKKM